MKPLGRLVPTDWTHTQKYALALPKTVEKVERVLKLPYWHWQHDQGQEGACVGFGCSMMMSILNEQQARATNFRPYVHKYNCRWLWNEAKRVDEWPSTNPGDDNGTSVRAACDVLRTLGHVRVLRKVDQPADISQGIKENRWATTVDEMRTVLSQGTPIAIGIEWFSSFDTPEYKNGEYWIGKKANPGYVRGGHCVCVFGASDKRQGFKIKNSWGRDYPLTWLSYDMMSKLFAMQAEATLVTDR